MGLRSRLCRTLEYFCCIFFMALCEEEPLCWNAEGASLTCWPSLQIKILSRPEPKVLINIGHLKTGGWNLPCYTSKLHSIKAKHMCQLQLCACSSRVGSSYRCVTGYWTRWAELLAVCALPTESTFTLCNRLLQINIVYKVMSHIDLFSQMFLLQNCKMLAVKKHLFTTQPSRPSVTSYNKTISSLNLFSWGKVPSSGCNYLQRNRETESDWEEKNTKWFFRQVCVLPIIWDINISFKFTHKEKKTKMNQMSRYCHIKSLTILLLKSY